MTRTERHRPVGATAKAAARGATELLFYRTIWQVADQAAATHAHRGQRRVVVGFSDCLLENPSRITQSCSWDAWQIVAQPEYSPEYSGAALTACTRARVHVTSRRSCFC